jgi:hypothetical protein
MGARSRFVVKDRKEDVVVEIESNICLMTESHNSFEKPGLVNSLSAVRRGERRRCNGRKLCVASTEVF